MDNDDKQTSLFGGEPSERPKQRRMATTAPYVPGSESSEEAARSLSPKILSELHRIVLDVIRARGREGATDDEIERITGLSHQTASARRRELIQREQAFPFPGRFRPTRSGRRAQVWISAETHADLIEIGEIEP